jgi:hypothetical protein
MLFEERLGGEERRLMHLVPAPVEIVSMADRDRRLTRRFGLRLESPGTYM